MLQATTPDATCEVCKRGFLRFNTMQRICGRHSCAMAIAKGAGKARRESVKVRREKLKTVRGWIKEAQIEFNKYIRARDRAAGHPCISSGAPLDWSGNAVDAGHYRSTGAAAHLRFDPDNCHAQSKRENQYLAGNAIDYRIGLIGRIGLARVEALEANNTPHKFTVDELKQLKSLYKAKAAALAKEGTE